MNSRNDGFTLVEILIVTLLSAVVMGSIHQMIIMQDRTTREQYAIVETQQNTRNALAVVTADLKEISAADGDVIYADSMDLQFRALRKAGLACNKEPGNNTIDVAELGAPFVQGDQVLLFADGTNPASSLDDTWLQLGVSMVGAGNCAANPLNAAAITRLTFTGTPLANVQVGALVRSFIQTRYRIIDNGEFGQLMRTEGGTETAIVENLATITDGGLRFRYFNAAGTQMPYNTLNANLDDIMSVQVKVRGKSVSTAKTTGANRFQDSLVTNVYMRGNFRTQ